MTNAPTYAVPAEVTDVDTSARGPLLLMIGSSLVWLLVSGVLALLTSIQLHTPGFLADCSFLTYGRAQALQESAFIYGWMANAGLAVALWILGRLGGSPLRALNWTVVGTLFWNLAIAIGLIGIATGDATSIAWLQLPRYVQLMMVFAYGAIAIPGVLAWSGRNTQGIFASQWYAVAALFLFPWLFSAAQMVLLWSPVRGVVQAIAAGWYAQSAWTLWLAPLALTGAYYIVPKVTGRVIPSYDFASLGFWTLLFVGTWTGGRHLIGGPTPAWIASVAIVSCSLLVFHYLIVALNLRGAFGHGGPVMKFISFGLIAYVAGGLLDAVTAFRSVSLITQFTYFNTAQQQLAILGGASMILFGSLYFAVPRLTGRVWASGPWVGFHYTAMLLGVGLLILTLGVAGWIQGRDLNQAGVAFADIAKHTRPWLLGATVAQFILLFGNLLFFVNFCRSVCACGVKGSVAPSPFRQPSTIEATAS